MRNEVRYVCLPCRKIYIYELEFLYQMIKINTGLIRPRSVCCCWTNWFIFGQSDGRHVLIKLSSQFKVIPHVAFAVVVNIVSMLMQTQMQRKGLERYHEHNVSLLTQPVYNLRIPFNLSIRMSNPKSNLPESTCQTWIWIINNTWENVVVFLIIF